MMVIEDLLYLKWNLECSGIFSIIDFWVLDSFLIVIRNTKKVTIQYKYSTMQHDTIQYNTIQYNTIQYNTIRYNTIQYNSIRYNTIQYNTIQYNSIRYNTWLLSSQTFYSILFYSTLTILDFYLHKHSILFYSTLTILDFYLHKHSTLLYTTFINPNISPLEAFGFVWWGMTWRSLMSYGGMLCLYLEIFCCQLSFTDYLFVSPL